MYAKGKEELCRNMPPRFSLKPPVGRLLFLFKALKGKKPFILLVPSLANPEPPGQYLVIAFTQGFSVAFSCYVPAEPAQLFSSAGIKVSIRPIA